MTVKFLGYHWKKRIFYPSVVLLAVTIIASFFINRYWSPILADRVKSTVLSSTDSLYTINFSDAQLHVLQGKLVINNIVIKPDMEVYNRRKQMRLAPNNLYELRVKRLMLRRIHPLRLYFKNQLHIEQIIVSEPDLRITYQLNHTHDTVANDRRNAWQRIKSVLKSIEVGEIDLNDVKFRYDDYSGIKLNISELKEMNITAMDMLIDSATQNDKSRFLYCRDLITELNNYHGTSANQLYKYQIKSLLFSTLTSKLNVYGLSLLPAQPEVYYRQVMHNRYNFYLDSLQANGFDFKNYIKYHTLSCNKLIMNGGRLNFASNAAIDSADKKDKLSSFPNVAIHRIHSRFKVDTVELHRINVRYEAYSKRSHKAGFITFDHTFGVALNVTSDKEALQKNNMCNLNLTTWLMGKGRIDAQFKFNLTDSAHSYSYQGIMGPMKLSALNPATKPLALLELKSGQLNRLDFNAGGDARYAKGHVQMLYNDLKVHVLRPDTVNDKLRHFTLGSIFANALILKHNNPDTTGLPARSYAVNYIRPNNAGFFKTLFKTLIPGIKASAGYDAATEKKVKATIKQRRLEKQQRLIKKAMKQAQHSEKKRAELGN